MARATNHAEIHEIRFVKSPGLKLSQLEKIAPASAPSVGSYFSSIRIRDLAHTFACDRRIPFKGKRSSNEPA